MWWARRADASEHLKELLDETERARLDAYARADDRDRFVVGCATAKLALSLYLDVPAAEIELSRTCTKCGRPHGKPRLRRPAGDAVEISISHSGELVLVALTRETPVGVDVEKLDRSLPIDELAHIVLADAEISELCTYRPSEQRDNFLVWWTRKEAVVKATGDGFETSPRNVVVTRPGELPRLLAWAKDVDPSHVALFDLGERDGHVASLATIGACTAVRAFDASRMLSRSTAGAPPRPAAEARRARPLRSASPSGSWRCRS